MARESGAAGPFAFQGFRTVADGYVTGMMIYTRDTLGHRSVRTCAHRRDSADIAALRRDALAVFGGRGRITSAELADGLNTEAMALASILRRFGVRPKAMKFGNRTFRGYEATQFS